MKNHRSKHDRQGPDYLEYFIISASLMGHIGLFLQAAKIFYLKSSYAVSLTGCVISIISSSIWLYYGLRRKIRPLIIANYVGIAGLLVVLLGILMYG